MCLHGSVPKPCLTPHHHVDCSLPGFSVHGILQARLLERVAISSSGGSSQPGDRIHVSYIGRQILYCRAIWAALWRTYQHVMGNGIGWYADMALNNPNHQRTKLFPFQLSFKPLVKAGRTPQFGANRSLLPLFNHLKN